MRIIPAIDIIDGKCVRLTQGDYEQKKVYNEDPLEVALEFQDHGIRYLHLVDLDGAKSKRIVNHQILEKLSTRTDLSIDFGGGIKTDEDIRIAFDCGAQQVTGGSIAVKDPDLFMGWLDSYGPDKIILGADSRDGFISTDGWLKSSDRHLLEFVQEYFDRGVRRVISTDIGRDGMLQGPATELYEHMLKSIPELKLIASGGISDISELPALAQIGCEGVIIGKAIYEGRISLSQLVNFKAKTDS
ncbi:1-(5-phosphoribosyl)-5-[(5-phosphoribosylamino)methylideneamino]imidazole-4-carboxamide isomerase [Aureitalea marina]|uniref:1-(5-phosphoribosyl)-5-[(5-phosphoribosylamino)methylideneamino] imidazole-4-carboxamide isomerase n=1 Tax=Aureitalea marina TaxID=930804 RepID=A0A2S7KP80_9FLAO|nr:1-(5-phosphoribosyl)-5-[(5-phosphoribosylamino)methylideneamino]imidazole-4-carboxamide isomerase [Aureitalea marina]PQB04436.1 1-(5-phosphoribosyl)-5-[(5-phosphoribosylamino)methylideneamino]imidazole-4-carboxamide isomerase [Aureitalea marina]